MDAAYIFRQGLGTVAPRQNQAYPHHQAHRKPANSHDDLSDGDGSGNRVAHTLTACCRCRQRKTRCDPTLPRCLPCERSGSTCEYFDAAKGRKINRYYVIKLQDKVRALEAELDQYTDEDGDYPGTNEDMVRPGGLIRLSISDETPRYLGPSSGIAMTRILMEEAKRYTDSKRISDLIPEVRASRQARMQSIQMTGRPSQGKRSYPMISEGPAEGLPTRGVVDKLVEMFNQKAQLFWPALHEIKLNEDLDAVYNGDTDTYKNFVVRMVIAISLQKLDAQYAGLADSYYLAAMQHVEDVIRRKDLNTLQCLVLIAQYSLLTPTRVPIYFVIGLASRICQQEGLTEEQTIKTGYNLDARTIDTRRRLVWVVATMEFGLAHTMGRPSAFAKNDDRLDVEFFSVAPDENITENGIRDGPPSDRKLVAIHFCRMRLLQAEIRAALYEKKHPDRKDDSDPWFERMDNKINAWLEESPENPPWIKPWFVGRHHQMRIFMYRPTPQIPKPSSKAASICYISSGFIIQLAKKQIDNTAVDVTWVFLLTLNMALNALLWATTHAEVRQAHPREEVEEMTNIALDVLDRCAARWAGTAPASQRYAVLAKACLQSYDAPTPVDSSFTNSSFNTPPTIIESQASPSTFSQASSHQQPVPFLQAPQFGQVFDSPPESMTAYPFDPNFPTHPTFRSNSIFREPATSDLNGRRFSYFPPDFTQPGDGGPDDLAPPGNSLGQNMSSSAYQLAGQLPSPPESIPTSTQSTTMGSAKVSPSVPQSTGGTLGVPTGPNLNPPVQQGVRNNMATGNAQQPLQPVAGFANTTQPPPPSVPQQPLPTATGNEWYTPPFASYNFPNISDNFFTDGLQGPNTFGDMGGPGLGFPGLGVGGPAGDPQFSYLPGRQDSLSQSQQMELMNVLETEGVGDIEAFLNASNNAANIKMFGV